MRCEIAEKKLKETKKKEKRNVVVEVRGEVVKKSAKCLERAKRQRELGSPSKRIGPLFLLSPFFGYPL